MRRIGVFIIILLLAGIICLQLLAALNIFPRTRIIQVCPVDAISMNNGKALIDATKCIGCKRCVLGVASLVPVKRETVPEAVVAPVAPAPVTETKEAQNTEALPTQKQTDNKDKKEIAVSQPKSANIRVVDSDTCIGCQLCVPNCPFGAIRMVDGKAVIDPEKCTDCGICELGNLDKGGEFAGCPVTAISRIKRSEN